jgi:hypothetical protein
MDRSEKQNALLSASRENRNDIIRHLIAHGGVAGDVASLCAYIRGDAFDYDTFEALLQGRTPETPLLHPSLSLSLCHTQLSVVFFGSACQAWTRRRSRRPTSVG